MSAEIDFRRREDFLLDKIREMTKLQSETVAWLRIYAESNFISDDVAQHLSEVVNGSRV